MSVTLTIRDETPAGNVFHEQPLEFPSDRISIRELIRERVYQEVEDFNRQRGNMVFDGLVQPTDAEIILNADRFSYRMKQRREINWKAQFEKATDAFEHNGFFVLIGDRQAESLDEQFTIGRDTQVSFVKLTQLVGG